MNRRLSMDRSLNAPVGEEGDGQWQDHLTDDRASQETAVAEAEERRLRLDFLKLGLGVLNEREPAIFIERRLRPEPVTLEELGQRFAVTRECIRQIEVRAFEKVQKAVMARAKAQQITAADTGRDWPRA